MKKQKVYAIVKKSSLKYSVDLRCPLMEGQLPIFWHKTVAKKHLEEYGIEDTCEIVRVYLEII